jgi:hypothetical protein
MRILIILSVTICLIMVSLFIAKTIIIKNKIIDKIRNLAQITAK